MPVSTMLGRRVVLSSFLTVGALSVFGRRCSFAENSSTPDSGELDPVTEVSWVKFNVNAASDEQLLTIPAMGDEMLRAFNAHEPFTSIEQFRREIGTNVSEEEVAAYEGYLFVPVDPTATDEATLQQLPGVSADIAAELAASLPFIDGIDLQSTLAQYVSASQAASAAQYLTPNAGDQARWVKFNLNTADDAQFLTIPGVGDQMLREFAMYRPYVSITQFREAIGTSVAEQEIATFERYLFVPVNPIQADEATLRQLPGVDGDEASALAQGMPYADVSAFVAALGGVVSAEQAATAAAFLLAV
jgi:DNA uptake protein ComE-like DNA-binding protein